MHGVKRTADVLVAGFTLFLLLPLVAVIALAIRLTMGSPVLFRQVRAGYQGREFQLLKFRTMKPIRDERGELLPDEARLTRLGGLLRQSSFDELPQLWNVLVGDMSFVGPRPLLIEYLPRYSNEQARRHEVRPGITGLAQVSGRNALGWDKKFELDVWYVDHWSLRLDAKILWKTIWGVIHREGISQEGHATMPKFKGSDRRVS